MAIGVDDLVQILVKFLKEQEERLKLFLNYLSIKYGEYFKLLKSG